MKLYLILFWGVLSCSVSAQQCHWSEWEAFQAHYINQGRIVVNANAQHSVDAQGQAHALLLSLIANDRHAFEQLLVWSEDNLAKGDFTAHSPSALSPTGQRSYITDLWFAYTLLEAGKKWDYGYYSNLGYLIAIRALTEEQLLTRRQQPSLTASPLLTTDNTRKVNSDYLPLQFVEYFAPLFPSANWRALYDSDMNLSIEAIESAFEAGSEGDTKRTAKQQDDAHDSAVEGYLWRVMLTTQHSTFAALNLYQQEQYLYALARLEKNAHGHYFKRLFTLFSDAWRAQRYQFTPQGGLDLAWETQCKNR